MRPVFCCFCLLLAISTYAQKVSLIPLPQQFDGGNGTLSLAQCRNIVVKDASLLPEALQLQQYFQQAGVKMNITDKNVQGLSLTISIGKVNAPRQLNEAYQLKVTASGIQLTANMPHGIFNGIQTLKQLLFNGKIAFCSITDWPAFSWRGYMIDVGRNYMSMPALKQQIDVMAANKLNVFHFHATEDIAWRIAIKKYPQLTDAAHMLRNKGKFYSEAEIKELIAYCKERHIRFVPEIDMPGHSAAFRRAMGTDMQADSGMAIVKNILEEFLTTYEVDYMHIGADEVKITNKRFILEMTAFIEGFGKRVIGWQPGGNFSGSTIRQLWMDDNAHRSNTAQWQFIDSRHLYLNHMDPLEGVATIFHRRIADKSVGDTLLLGGTICMWHDRAVRDEMDILTMNPVYPGMLAFAERSWRGGGSEGWKANIGAAGSPEAKAFAAFEERLLDHKLRYYAHLSFPYVRQSHLEWKLLGPFLNNGDLAKIFPPESTGFNQDTSNAKFIQTGATIILRHWWAPLISGALLHPEDSTTWYATTKFWSENAGTVDCWIGFNNLSRSPATDTPPAGEWDHKKSRIWVNNRLVPAPEWKRAGRKGYIEIPLEDEGYEYRTPTKVPVKKGWNTVLIKLPVGSFKGKDWQNPVKWMFTFVPLE